MFQQDHYSFKDNSSEDFSDEEDAISYYDLPPIDMREKVKEANRNFEADSTPINDLNRVTKLRFKEEIAQFLSPRESDSDDGYGDSSEIICETEDENLMLSTTLKEGFVENRTDITSCKNQKANDGKTSPCDDKESYFKDRGKADPIIDGYYGKESSSDDDDIAEELGIGEDMGDENSFLNSSPDTYFSIQASKQRDNEDRSVEKIEDLLHEYEDDFHDPVEGSINEENYLSTTETISNMKSTDREKYNFNESSLDENLLHNQYSLKDNAIKNDPSSQLDDKLDIERRSQNSKCESVAKDRFYQTEYLSSCRSNDNLEPKFGYIKSTTDQLNARRKNSAEKLTLPFDRKKSLVRPMSHQAMPSIKPALNQYKNKFSSRKDIQKGRKTEAIDGRAKIFVDLSSRKTEKIQPIVVKCGSAKRGDSFKSRDAVKSCSSNTEQVPYVRNQQNAKHKSIQGRTMNEKLSVHTTQKLTWGSNSQHKPVRKAASTSNLCSSENNGRNSIENVYESWLQNKKREATQIKRHLEEEKALKKQRELAKLEERKRLANEAFDQWLVRKREQLRRDKRVEKIDSTKKTQISIPSHDKTKIQCEVAYKEWLRKKQDEIKSRRFTSGSSLRSRSLERTWTEERTRKIYTSFNATK